MKHKLHKSLPNWMIATVNRSCCSECNNQLVREDILGIGIKEIGVNQIIMFVEVQCPKCNHAARLNFSSQPGAVEDICYLLLDEIQKKRRIQKSKELECDVKDGSLISEKETSEFIKNMNESETFEEFLKLIGASRLTDRNNNDEPKA